MSDIKIKYDGKEIEADYIEFKFPNLVMKPYSSQLYGIYREANIITINNKKYFIKKMIEDFDPDTKSITLYCQLEDVWE